MSCFTDPSTSGLYRAHHESVRSGNLVRSLVSAAVPQSGSTTARLWVSRVGTAAVVAAFAAGMVPGAGVASADTLPRNCTQSGTTVSCGYGTAEGSFYVPAGVTSITVDATGGQGQGPSSPASEVIATIPVTFGDTVFATILGGGSAGAAGSGGLAGNGGGQASFILIQNAAYINGPILLLAGGSGGAGSAIGAGGDATTTAPGTAGAPNGQQGGTVNDPNASAGGGSGGSAAGTAGNPGNGGGAGLFGGGGGGASTTGPGGAGGAGSSLVPAGGTEHPAARGVPPSILISYSTAPADKRHTLSKGECKDNGWQNFDALFKNQGACVSAAEHGTVVYVGPDGRWQTA